MPQVVVELVSVLKISPLKHFIYSTLHVPFVWYDHTLNGKTMLNISRITYMYITLLPCLV